VVVVVGAVVVGAGVGGALDGKAVVGVEGSGVGGGANDGAGVGENDGAAVSGAVVGKAVVEAVSGVEMSAESVDSPVVAVGSVVAGGKVVAVGNGVAPQIFHPDRVTRLSLVHSIVVPAVTWKLSGPSEPSKYTLPMRNSS
jgi:hypothetical protein